MTQLKHFSTRWLLRSVAALTFAFTALAGVPGMAMAHDDDEVVTYGPNACTAVADLPAYPSATCRKHKTELDDGVTETTNSYVTADSANAVRLAFEKAFANNGWTIVKSKQDLRDQEWDYTVVKGLRRVKVDIEAQEPDEGTGTEFSIEEG
ncbi:MAG TPA: hypothetical protein VFU22_11825 [Roseiflexaceae bacterium]|nr:hypothetical protein [Roseiflexaceae bacterium]